jgi:hypothetical protein
MSNKYNDDIRESILEDIEGMTVYDFKSLLIENNYIDLHDDIDIAVSDLVHVLFNKPWE